MNRLVEHSSWKMSESLIYYYVKIKDVGIDVENFRGSISI